MANNCPIATAWVKASAVKAGRQDLGTIMCGLHDALRHRGVKGLIYDSYLLLPRMQDPVTQAVIYDGPSWKLTAMGENYGDGFA